MEGEFKKRIKNILTNCTHEYRDKGILVGDPNAFPQGVGAALGKLAFSVAEAKKEFPTLFVYPKEPGRIFLEEERMKKEWEKHLHEWFKKWFGE